MFADAFEWRSVELTPITRVFTAESGLENLVATTSPGFAVDEDPAHLGEALRLPKQHEHLRSHLEQILRPVENPRRVAA